MKKHLIILIIGLVGGFSVSAQSLFNNHLYTHNLYSVNPSYAGSTGDLSFRFQSAIYPTSRYESPEFISVYMEAAFFENLAAGGFFTKEVFGSQEQTVGQAALAYRIGFLNNSKLSFGLAVGFSDVRLQTEKLNLSPYVDRTDPVLGLDDFAQNDLTMGFGVNYSIAGFDVGLSMPNLLRGQDFGWQESNMVASYTYLLRGFPMKVRPNVAYFTRIEQANVFDGSVQVEWNSKLWMQGGMRTNGVSHAGIGLNMPQIRVGYVFGWMRGDVSQFLGSKHELMISFSFNRSHKMKLGSSRLIVEDRGEENYRDLMNRFDQLTESYNQLTEEVLKKSGQSVREQQELKKLKEDINVLKGQLQDEEHTVVVRDELLSDKIEVKKGYYLVVASCRRLICAEDVVKDFESKGEHTELVLNRGKGIYYITSGFYEDYQEALEAMMQKRASGVEDAWVLVNDSEE